MEKMHYNKQCNNNLMQSDRNDKNNKHFIPTTNDSKRNAKNSEIILSFDVNKRNEKLINQQNETADIGTYTGSSTTSCTSSTDSGVNISDTDEIPPSPISSHMQSFPSSTSSASETTKTDNNINNCKGNEFNNNFNTNDNNDVDNNNDYGNSANIDNKLKIEQHRKRQQQQQNLSQQQFLKVENSSNGGNNIQYQSNQNIIESENVININHQRNLTTTTTATTTTPQPKVTLTTTTAKYNDKTSLQHNEVINPPQRSASTSSSLSMSSSIANSYDQKNPPSSSSNMQYCNGSPVVSIRSINSSTIITSDSDSDLDLNSDSEGVHENYVIKKLGTQVTYPPKHPNIPNINSGQTILNQKVIQNVDQVPESPLAALAAIGDNIGAAQALGPVPSFLAVPQRPQIGSIALSNSSDVTFGDKHFYEGPVTIQQFLIDGRDKWKETNGKENPTFANDNPENTNNAKDINSSAEQSDKLYGYLLKRKKIIIPGVLAVIALLIVATIFGSRALNDDSKNTNGYDAGDVNSECSSNATLCLIGRDVWRAHHQRQPLDKQNLPLHRVIISHTASEPCDSIKICAQSIRVIQEFHMNSIGWDDIGYNFLISSDGLVYEGRGWDAIGAHTKGYNTDSVGIAFIGTYIKAAPSEAQLKACLALLEEGVRLKKLAPNYHVYGARQFAATESPGEILYRIIKKWPQWSNDIESKKV